MILRPSLFVLVLVAGSPAGGQELDPSAALEELASDDFAVRQAASRRLEEAGPAVLPALRAHRTDDPEVRRRVAALIEAIEFAAADRERIWPVLTAGNPWQDPDAFAGATIEFSADGRRRLVDWIVHGSGRPVVGADRFDVAIDGLEVAVGPHRYRLDAATGCLHSLDCTGARLTPDLWVAGPCDRARLADGDPFVRREALHALARSEDARRRVAEMAALLDDPDASVRSMAAWALGRYDHRPAAGRLRELLADPDPTVRREAVVGLGLVAGGDDREAIAALSTDDDPTVRRHVEQALERIRRR